MGYFFHHLHPDIKNSKKTQTFSLEDFEKETIRGL